MRIKKIELVGYKRMKLNDYNSISIDFDSPIQQILGTNGSGKAQPLSARIKIPGGWTTMGELKVGDEVICRDGTIAKVTNIYPQGIKEVFKVTMKDDRSTLATKDHLWKVYQSNNTEVVTTEQILNKKDIWIDLIEPEITPDVPLQDDPYLFGVMLANQFTTNIDTLESIMKGSIKQRRSLLEGLIYKIPKDHKKSFKTTNYKIAKNIQYLVWSLGGIADIEVENSGSIQCNDFKQDQDNYVVNIRYGDLSKIEIVSIEPHSIQECQCIRIDHPEHLYVTDDFIVTHNSSLMSELNPLPGDHRDFEKGGKKHIWIHHRGNDYECISDFKDGNKHTFIKNGEVLNELGNAKIQSELVYQEFKYDKKIRDLLLGKIRFTNMTPNQRREWFTELSEVNYDYAIKLYMKMKERLRDVTGSIREYKRRLVLESAKVLKDEEIKKLKTDVSKLHNEITTILDKRINPEYTSDQASIDQSELLRNLESISKSILTKKIKQPIHVNSINELDEHIVQVQSQIAAKDALIDQLTQEANKIRLEANLLKQAGIEGVVEIDLKLMELDKLRQEKLELIQSAILFDDPNSARSGLEAVQEELIDICLQLPINSDKSISQSYIASLRQSLENKTNEKVNKQNQTNKLMAFKLHLEDHKAKDHIQCPKCTHQWKLGYDENKYQQVKNNIEQLGKDIENLDKDIKDINEKIQYVNDYAMLFRRYKAVLTARPELAPLFSYIEKEEILIHNPKSIQSLIDKTKHHLNIQCELKDINKEYEKVDEVRKVAESSSLQSLNQANEKIDSYSLEINKHTRQKTLLMIQKEDYLYYKNEVNYVLTQADRLNDYLNQKDDLDKKTIKAIIYEILTDELKTRQSTLAIKEDILSEANNQINIILDLEHQIEQLSIDQEALSILVDQLSPKEGLIAEGLLGFMNSFIKRVNRVISKVWTYPLEIQSCSLENNESVDLDYKFPLVVVDDNNIKDDVSLGSDGMKEIINLSFVLVAMQCLDMQDYPVMLDEFSNTFDESHRLLAVELIKNLLDHYSFSQLFIVSHYLTLHGAITNAQICLLNDSNISVNTVVNQHVTFA